MWPIEHGEALASLGSVLAALSLFAGLATRTVTGLLASASTARAG